MTQFLLSIIQPDGPAPAPAVLGPIMRDVEAWNAELKAAGAWVFTGGLHPVGDALVVRPAKSEMLVTDGPFAEGKEHLGGFVVIRAEGRDAALGWAKKLARATTLAIEVRELREGPRA